jgi:hypothetical protein
LSEERSDETKRVPPAARFVSLRSLNDRGGDYIRPFFGGR